MKKINDLEEYLNSDDFKGLCTALDFFPKDIEEIKNNLKDLNAKEDLTESVVLTVYNQLLKYEETPRDEKIWSGRLIRCLDSDDKTFREDLFYRTIIRDADKWEDIKNKLRVGIQSGKITSDYDIEKEFSRELDLIEVSEYKNAMDMIYLHEIHYLLEFHRIYGPLKRAVFRDACLNGRFYTNPLLFCELKEIVDEKVEIFSNNLIVPLKDLGDDHSLNGRTFIIKNDILMDVIDSVISYNDEEFSKSQSEFLCIYPSLRGGGMIYFAISTWDEKGFKKRNDFSNVFIIDGDLIRDNPACFVDTGVDYRELNDYYMEWKFGDKNNVSLGRSIRCGFQIFKTSNTQTGKILYTFESLKKEEKSTYDHENLYEIASQNPLSEEFLGLLSSLNMDIDFGYEIRNKAKDSDDVLGMLNWRILDDKAKTSDDLEAELEKLYVKAVLASKEKSWDKYKKYFNTLIRLGEIKSVYDLHSEFNRALKTDAKTNIIYAQIEAILEFRGFDFKYAQMLASHIKRNILDNDLAEFLNTIAEDKITEKPFADEGKYAAPRWLVYPELDAYTMGWRMGYGEDYAMNEPPRPREFHELFPRPLNWIFDTFNAPYKPVVLMGYMWSDNGKPKYSKITDDAVEVSDFITIKQRDMDFQYNAEMFKSIKQAVSYAKAFSISRLKRDRNFKGDVYEHWERYKYSVLLNACYYKFMNDEILKEKLLATGDRTLVYSSDDEWGGEDNLFGFALMELRDEIRRLYENEDKIDWEYTEYLKNLNPYDNPKPRNPNDEQSPEYMVVRSTLMGSSRYVRDVNLDENLAEKYEPGQIITERGFVDASNRIGGMATSHRYLILSQYMADLSKFEDKTNWGLHTANMNSRFKVLDVFTFEDKTQILLLQLPDGFEGAFENTTNFEKQFVESEREKFKKELKMDVVAELAGDEWLERCSFPLGMNEEGEFFES